MKRWKLASRMIASLGYDALCAVLEVEYLMDGQVRQYLDVPEGIWYSLKASPCPEGYLNQNVVGKYQERNLSEGERSAIINLVYLKERL